jgi:D-glycero-alpha-D-manno-heptose 1-phosphate guanylyltransferase
MVDMGGTTQRINEAIILAGGLGTRLRSVVPDLPKAMAPVAGKAFLGWLITRLKEQGITRIILSLGYRHEAITTYILEQFPDLDVQFSIEDEPLGTGGGIRKACSVALSESVVVMNGDTCFHIDLSALAQVHHTHAAQCTLALKPMENFDRYGVVECASDGSVTGFREKQRYASGLINGGVYLLNRGSFLSESLPEKFSFEKDYLEAFVGKRAFFGYIDEGYFIDIGIPADFERAQIEIPELFS